MPQVEVLGSLQLWDALSCFQAVVLASLSHGGAALGSQPVLCYSHTHCCVARNCLDTRGHTQHSSQTYTQDNCGRAQVGPGIGCHVTCVALGGVFVNMRREESGGAGGSDPSGRQNFLVLEVNRPEVNTSPRCQSLSQNRSLLAGKWVMITF